MVSPVTTTPVVAMVIAVIVPMIIAKTPMVIAHTNAKAYERGFNPDFVMRKPFHVVPSQAIDEEAPVIEPVSIGNEAMAEDEVHTVARQKEHT
jgi:hypothetical protein